MNLELVEVDRRVKDEAITLNPSAKINLIMNGGGVRLAAYVGAISAFRDMGLHFGAIAGSSGGSIIGAFLAAGWSPERMHAKVLDTDFTAFKDRRIRSLLFEGGLYVGDVFERWIDRELEGVRFIDLSSDLFVITVDLIGQQSFVFSRYTSPEVAVSKAVRCSMAIPWVWRPERWGGKLLADGQLLSWTAAGIETMQRSPGGMDAARTVMVRLMSDPPAPPPAKSRLWPWDLARIVLETMLTALENQRVPGPLWDDTILIRVGQTGPLQLNLGRAVKEELFCAGYDQATHYFNKGSAGVRTTTP